MKFIPTDVSDKRRVMQAALDFMTLKIEAPGKPLVTS
jgi:hypothetical protein